MIKKRRNPVRRLSLILTVGVFVLAAFGCGGGGGSSSDSTPTTPGTPSISTQGALNFGTAVIPNSPIRTVTVKNSGTADLAIGQISLQQAGTPFSIPIASDNCSNKSIPANGTCSVAIQLGTASAAVQVLPYSNTLIIPSNDSVRNPLQLPMAGKLRNYFVNINEVKYTSCPTLQLLVSVTDANGAPVGGLEGFMKLFEDGAEIKPPQLQTVFPATTDNLSLVLLLDYSPSILDLNLVQESAKTFIDLLKSTDEISIVKFSKTRQPTSFTFTEVDAQKLALKAVIDEPFTGDLTGTALYDSVYDAISAISLRTKPRKAVIVLSDGYDDNTSTMTLDEAIQLGLQNGLPVFSIGIMKALEPRPEVMRDLALETGGAYFEAPDESALEEIYLKIAGILSDQYLIEYTSASSGGVTVSLDVEVDNAGLLGEGLRDVITCP